MLIERELVIERSIGDVFDFVADSRNDPRWCPKVHSVEQVEGDGPGPGARYAVVHKPVPGRPARDLDMRCVAADRPHRIELIQDDGTDSFRVTYELSETDGGTRIVQRSDAEIGAVPRILHPLWKHGIGRDVARQLRELKKLLEHDLVRPIRDYFEATWGHRESERIDSVEQLDALLDHVDADSRRSGLPQSVALTHPRDAGTLDIVVGADRSLLSHVRPDAMPPYMTSIGDEDRDAAFTFYVEGDHHSECAWRQTVDPAVAREAARSFFETGRLDERVRWEEV